MSGRLEEFDAFVAEIADDTVVREVRTMPFADLGPGDVTIRVTWSGVNYKDALATLPGGRVARLSPLVPGIDLAGVVVDSHSREVEIGDEVLVHGYRLGVAHHGGYGEYARVPGDWVVPLPPGLSAREAMSLGTAGFTAALSVRQLEARGLRPGDGPVLVTGASGGVGSVAVGILAARQYEVVASSGKPGATEWLRDLGAVEVVGRLGSDPSAKALDQERWAGAIDCVGGDTLAAILRSLRYGAAVAATGNTGGPQLTTTVFPFILRGAALLGVDSVDCPISVRRELWRALAEDLRPQGIEHIATAEVTLAGLPAALDRVHAGSAMGRTLVRVE